MYMPRTTGTLQLHPVGYEDSTNLCTAPRISQAKKAWIDVLSIMWLQANSEVSMLPC